MKKFKLDLKTNPPPKDKQPKSDSTAKVSKEDIAKAQKKSELEKEMQLLQNKIAQAAVNIKSTEKILDIDMFFKKQKEKSREYAKRLNEDYDHQKRQREKKLYKKYNREQPQGLQTKTIKSQTPLKVLNGLDQLRELDSNGMRKWILNDHHYKLGEMLLDSTRSQLFGPQMRQEEKCLMVNQQEDTWRRIKQISSNCSQTKYLNVSVESNQLEPSDYGECIMSALNLMPLTLSDDLYKAREGVDKQDYFLCKFYPGGEPKSVLTNQWIQVREFAHKFVNISSRHKNNTTFWSSLIEKAYKKLYFGRIEPKNLLQTFSSIYGLQPEFISFSNRTTIVENLPKMMHTLLTCSPKGLIGFINTKSQSYNRIYPLVNVIFPSEGKTQKNVKNKLQGEVRIKEILYQISNPYANSILKSDFTNKFTINELFQTFNKLVVLRDYPAKWGGYRIFIEFLSNGPISLTGTDWVKNNQYSFTLIKQSAVRLILRRKWDSILEKETQLEGQKMTYGFVLFRSSEGETQVSCMKLDGLVHRCKSSEDNGSTFTGKLQKGTYVLIPFSHAVSQQYLQQFNLDIICERQQVFSINNNANEKTLQKLSYAAKYEKPKYEKIMCPKIFKENEKGTNQKYLQSLNLALMAGVSLQDFYVPGKLGAFLTNGSQKQENQKRPIAKTQQATQLEKYQRDQALKTLLGYDVLMGEDINHGQMLSIIQDTSDEVDFSSFGLGQEGFLALMEPLMSLPRITKLNFASNNLNDSAVTYLCYYLQKGMRKQLRQLNLTGNDGVTKLGIKALKGLKKFNDKLEIIGVIL